MLATVPPLIVPPTKRQVPMAGDRVNVVPALSSVPWRLTTPPLALKVPSAAGVNDPCRPTDAPLAVIVPALTQLAPPTVSPCPAGTVMVPSLTIESLP